MNKILRNLDKEEDIFIGLDIQKKVASYYSDH